MHLNIDLKSEEEILSLLEEAPDFFRYIKNPTFNVIKKAIEEDKSNIKLIDVFSSKEITKLICSLIKKNPYIIQYIENPTEQMQLLAIKNDNYALDFIKNPTEKVISVALQKNIDVIESIIDRNPPKFVVKMYIKYRLNNDCVKNNIQKISESDFCSIYRELIVEDILN